MANKLIQLKDSSDNMYPTLGVQGMHFEYSSTQADYDATGISNVWRVLYGMFDSALYISFDINWVRLQFRVRGASIIESRCIYGGSTVQPWKTIV